MATEFNRTDVNLGNWRNHPFNTYSFHHVAEFVPSVDIAVQRDAALEAPAPLPDLQVRHAGLGRVSIGQFLAGTHGDSFVALKDGKRVAEWYAPHSSPTLPHLVFSVSKSITGMLAGVAVGDGRLDPEAPVSAYISVKPDSAYATATVRNVLDMAVRLDFVEDYLNLDGPFDRYRRAMLWNPERPGTKPETMRDVLPGLGRTPGSDGELFQYLSPNTDIAGLVIEAATGQRLADYLGSRIWAPMGATGNARITVDRQGAPRTAGGMSVTPRDLALFGDLVMNDGKSRDGKQLIPAEWIDDMRTRGNRDAWAAGGFPGQHPGGSYRSYWYVAGDGNGFAADGIHGQRLWVDPKRGVSIVKLSSFPLPDDDAAKLSDFDVLAQIAAAL